MPSDRSADGAKPPREAPEGASPQLGRSPYFFFAGFAAVLLLGAFLVPHPQAIVIPPVYDSE